jgi:hypothetical protein
LQRKSLLKRVNDYRTYQKPQTVDTAKYTDKQAQAITGFYNPEEVVDLFERFSFDSRQIAFCLETALGYPSVSKLIKKLGISDWTYYKWKHDPKIIQCVDALKRNRRLFEMATYDNLRNRMYQSLHELLDYKVTSANFASKKELLVFIHKLLEGGQPTKKTLRVAYQEEPVDPYGVESATERDVTPSDRLRPEDITPDTLNDLRKQLVEKIDTLEVLHDDSV